MVVRMDAEQGGTKALRPCNIAKLLGAEMMAPFTAPVMATMNAPIQAFGPASVATRSTAQTPNTAGMFPTGARVVMHGLQGERHRALNLTCGTVVAVRDGSVLVKTDKALAPEGTSQVRNRSRLERVHARARVFERPTPAGGPAKSAPSAHRANDDTLPGAVLTAAPHAHPYVYAYPHARTADAGVRSQQSHIA